MKTSPSRAVLPIVLISYLMLVLDGSIVITALPRIKDELHFTSAGLSWVQSAYTLAFGGLLMLGARAGDILGRRRMFMAGLGLFTAASLAIGLAQTPAWLLLARAVQGAGAAILAPSTLALLSTNFAEGAPRTRALAYHGSVAGIGASAGLVLGGVIADWASWRVGFFINLPIGLLLMAAAHRCLAETERHSGRFDLAGALSSTVGMGALVYGVVRSAGTGWSDAATLASVTAGVLSLAVFVQVERGAAQPIMPLRLFADSQRNAAYLARLLFLGAMMGFWFFTTQFLQGVLGFTAFQAGLAFLPMTLTNFAIAVSVPKLTKRFGNGPLLAGGLAVALAGVALLSRVSTDTAYLTGVALPMLLIGIGQGAALSPLTVAAVSGVPAQDAGAASGVVTVAHQFGGSLGLAVLVVVFSSASGGLTEKAMLAHRIGNVLAASSAMLVLALAVVLGFIVAPNHRARAICIQPKKGQL
ncbi:MFS transporter [Pseudoduganella aquatica]|uniref:MFS transporter n=1 Tax=Pseudoduganella aquatica TaxID=2660641 RepID=A0A7X4KKR0_9BURK|nr:MFS transporter [Pseudoduganella aquatica]MYN06283.1 MFS transporter [Pseudoduganella aquatica]